MTKSLFRNMIRFSFLLLSAGFILIGAQNTAAQSRGVVGPLIPRRTRPKMSRVLPRRDFGAIRRQVVGSNINLFPNPGIQSETSIQINPNNPNNIIAGANIIFGLAGAQATYASTNGGASWTFVDQSLTTSTGNSFIFGSDPFIDFDTNGNAYFSYLLIGISGGSLIDALVVAKSTNGGITWSNPVPIVDHTGQSNPDFEDHEAMAIDKHAGSPFRNNIYVAWSNFFSGGIRVHFSRSTNGGTTWSVPIQVDSPGTGFIQFAVPAVGPNGEVYVVWADFGVGQMRVAKSIDGGQSFGPPVNVAPFQLPFGYSIPAQPDRGIVPAPSIAVDGMGAVYVQWADLGPNGATDVDMLLRKSVDGGQTWGALGPAPKRVNNDPLSSSASQFHGWMAIDPGDNSVNISYYDTRDDPSNQLTHYYLSRSIDGGQTFGTLGPGGIRLDTRITTEQSDESVNNPARDSGNNYGDYTSIAAMNGVLFACWCDNRPNPPGTGTENVFAARIVTGGSIRGTVRTTPEFGSRPIQGATVDVLQGGMVIQSTVTDALGNYSIGGLSAGSYDVRATATGFLTVTIANQMVSTGSNIVVDFALVDDGTRIAGRVTKASDGSPVNGADLIAILNSVPVATAKSNMNGDYIIVGLAPANDYTVRALAPRLGGGVRMNIVVTFGNTTSGIDFQLSTDPGAIIGSVRRSSNNTPIPGVSVQAKQNGVNVGAAVTSDTNGSYVISGLLAGTYDLEATPPPAANVAPKTVTNIQVFPGQTTENVNIFLDAATATITGQVVRSTDNLPLQGATIMLLQGANTVATTTSNVGGFYGFTGLATGTYDLTAMLEGFVNVVRPGITVVAGQVLELDLTMVPTTGGGGGGGATTNSLSIVPGVNIVTIPSNLMSPEVRSFFPLGIQVAKYDPQDPNSVNGYVISPPFSFNLVAGEAYFIKTANPATLPIMGNPISLTQDFVRNMPNASTNNPVWALVGNPFPAALTWDLSRVRFSVNGSAPAPLTSLVSDANAPITFYGWKWNSLTNSYVLVCDPSIFLTATNQIGPGEGLFVLSKASGVQLILPPPQFVASLISVRRSAKLKGQSTLPISESWSFELVARSGDAISRGNLIGVGSTAGRSLKMLAPPPPIGGKFVDLRFGNSGGSPVKVDLHASATINDSWEFEVSTDQTNSDVEVAWGNLARVPKAYRLSLVDLSNGTRRAMRTTTGYTFRSNMEGITTRRFRVELGPASSGVRLSNVRLSGSSGRYSVSFMLNRTADIRMAIIAPSGKSIRSVEGRGLRSGLNSLVWDGRTEIGTVPPRGVYIIQVIATDEEGGQFRAISSSMLR